MPIITVGDRYQDVWIAAVLATAMGAINAFLLAKLAGLFRGRTVLGFMEDLGAGVSAKVVAFIFTVFSVHMASITLRDFAELMVTSFYQETPLIVFIVVMAVLAYWLAYMGIEVTARVAQFVFPLIIGGIVLLNLSSLSLGGAENMFPLIEKGVSPIVRGGITHWAFFADVAIWFLLIPHLNSSVKNYNFLPLSVLASGLLLVFTVFSIVLGIGNRIAVLRIYPYLTLLEEISLVEFIERVEGFFLIIWVASNFLKIVLFLYAGSISAGHLFRLGDHRAVLLPLMIIAVNLSVLLFDNYQQLRYFFRPEVYAPSAAIIQLGIPAYITVLWLFRSRSADRMAD
ncbi:GerAB/ArcD/ProY family transporter [Phosphitispora fastidiosa]|uniref:GerAB/ArcD/ProY family transporter n=1 Tax=Phosphitispora fastidiosa TaxID=2837202 RepID=UPI001E4316B1|nr:spore germination protein KB [Phosphitispora fastidiosa]